MRVSKYSKPASDVLGFKQDFFTKDQELHKENLRLAHIYGSQPRRDLCKNCGFKLDTPFFIKHDIEYYLCSRCTHLNGAHEDTDSYVEQVYLRPESDYAKYYRSVEKQEYVDRVKKVYSPKVDFLLECLLADGRYLTRNIFARKLIFC
ncbi:hypothetical protein K0T92_09510 [Paenibacillus oenotherae]|uniref:Uncharacterized protein n=1 Tax=Paenibacillus oenotherae TaxID=1435645 RepID=A0ABS7D667_9BACL|nr:hypothetical protein [Paenibacillus oenotherae]MBW7474981.1 hypothetical protein [Paenibacillus oenotherae]